MLALPTDEFYVTACYACIRHLYLTVRMLACSKVDETFDAL